VCDFAFLFLLGAGGELAPWAGKLDATSVDGGDDGIGIGEEGSSVEGPLEAMVLKDSKGDSKMDSTGLLTSVSSDQGPGVGESSPLFKAL